MLWKTTYISQVEPLKTCESSDTVTLTIADDDANESTVTTFVSVDP